MRKLVAGLMILGLASFAAAAPTLDWSPDPAVEVAPGLYATTVYLHANDDAGVSMYVDITFTGNINQVLGYCPALGDTEPRPIDKESDANVYDMLDPNYDKDLDTWVYNPWAENFGIPVEETATSYRVSAGTGGGSSFDDGPFVYLVGSGVVHYEGTLSRLGANYPVSGDIPLPEPTTLLLVVAGAGLAIRRKR